MKTYNSLNPKERNEFNLKLRDFLRNNNNFSLQNRAERSNHKTSPSGSDLFDPVLWKDSHWKWYFEDVQGMVFNKQKKMLDQMMFPWKKS